MNDIMKSKKDWTGNSKAIYSCHGGFESFRYRERKMIFMKHQKLQQRCFVN